MATRYNSETDWLDFKAHVEAQETAEATKCPFCGIRHAWGGTHPFCDMATRFRFWVDAGRPRQGEGV